MLHQAFFPRVLNVLVVLPVLALAACDPMTAQPTVPTRPVLVTNAHFESQVSERSFVGTVRPRIESDLGFGWPEKSRNAWLRSALWLRPASRWRYSMRIDLRATGRAGRRRTLRGKWRRCAGKRCGNACEGPAAKGLVN